MSCRLISAGNKTSHNIISYHSDPGLQEFPKTGQTDCVDVEVGNDVQIKNEHYKPMEFVGSSVWLRFCEFY